MHVAAMRRAETGMPNDDELLIRCVDDDQVAFKMIFDRYSRQVYAAALIILEHHTDAEDVLSDTFVLFWRKRSSITLFAGSLLPWLITTSRNHARNAKRSRLRSRVVSLEENRTSVAADGADLVAGARDLSRQLDMELARLEPIDQQIVRLCLVDNTTYEEAARLLRISHSSVRNRLARARIRLRNGLSPDRREP